MPFPRDRTSEAIEIIKENARYAGALVKRVDGKQGLEFSDVAFPVVKPSSGFNRSIMLRSDDDMMVLLSDIEWNCVPCE